MTAASGRATDGLASGQVRAMGLTLGALYAFHAARSVIGQVQFEVDSSPGQHAVSALVWLPGLLALVAFVANRVRAGLVFLTVAAPIYPIAVCMWPWVAVPGDDARLDFWIHQIPGLAAIAALVTLPRWIAWGALFANCLIVELVMREIGLVAGWDVTLVRSLFSIAYSGFFFVLVMSMLAGMARTNRVLRRNAHEQAETAIMQARDQEIARLDRLTHDYVLPLLSSAAAGVPASTLRVQVDTVRRQLTSGFTGGDAGPLAEVMDRIARSAERSGVEVARFARVPAGTRAESPGPRPSTELLSTPRMSTPRMSIPRESATELEAAVEEAVRNTVRHGHGRHRLAMTLDDAGLTVQVSDDGPGFEPERIHERLGVSRSILHRMNTLPGGHARIDAEPGRGTVVTIHWGGP